MARWGRSISLRWKVPALIALAIVVAVAFFGIEAYLAIRRTAFANAFARLGDVSRQIASLIDGTMGRSVEQARRLANEPTVRAAVRSPTADRLAAAQQVLSRVRLDSASIFSVELRDPQGRLLVAHGPFRSFHAGMSAHGEAGVAVSPLRVENDSVFWDVVAHVPNGHAPPGMVRVVRRIGGPSDNTEAVLDLIGGNAALLVGNADGSLWSDLDSVTSRPPPRPEGSRYTREVEPRLAVSTPLKMAPWVIAIEHPEREVLAPARSLLRRFGWLSLLVVATGALVGDRLTRGITGSLSRLTTASEAIAAGNLATQPQEIRRDDEIGRLSRAFMRMSDAVRLTHEEQERRIAERTAQLEGTLARLREAQEELVRKERLATLGQLSSSVGHELRNPLGVMANAVYFLQMTLGAAPPKSREYLDLLEAQIRLSERIVSDLLGFTRIREPQREAVAVEDVVEGQLTRTQIPDTIRLVRAWSPGLPLLNVDPVQVGQIVLNLVTNAVQAMEDRCGNVTIGAEAVGQFVRLEVRDSGPGIAPGDLERIFEPLFTTKARGIGLGLAVSRSLAQVNGGRLWAANHPMGGAVFRLELPVVPMAG